MSDIEPRCPVILIKSQSILQRGAAKLHFLCTKPKKPTLTRRNKEKPAAQSCRFEINGAPGPIRTADTRFRRAVLYPLSYEGMWDILLT